MTPGLIRVETPRFVAAMVDSGGKIIEAAPILRKYIGKPTASIIKLLESKGARITFLGGSEIRSNAPIFFSSGLTDPGEVVGFAEVGMNVGVASNAQGSKWFKKVEIAILALRRTPTLVFLDNGAFAEVEIRNGKLSVRSKITNQDWIDRMELAVRWATRLGNQLYVVAPDRVGSQSKTFARLLKYERYVRTIKEKGANIIAVLQRGPVPYLELDEKISKVVGKYWIRGFPMKKKATDIDKLVEYVSQAKPARIHLLGLGPRRRGFNELMAILRQVSPNTIIYHDAVIIRSVLERAGEMGGKTRALTAAQDEIRRQIDMNLYGDPIAPLDFTEIWDTLDYVVETKKDRIEFATMLGFSKGDEHYKMILESVDGWIDTMRDRFEQNIQIDFPYQKDIHWESFEESYVFEAVKRIWQNKVLPVAKLTRSGKIRYKDPEWVRSEIRRQAIVKVFGAGLPSTRAQEEFMWNPPVLRPVRMSYAI
jgi:hypothetical protein